MDKIEKGNIPIILIVGIIVIIFLSSNQNTSLFSTSPSALTTDCPNSFRWVSYSPLNNAPDNFVSRIKEGGKGCVLKENYIQTYFQNSTIIESECEDRSHIPSGELILLDGVVIDGGYNYTGSKLGTQTYYIDLPFCKIGKIAVEPRWWEKNIINLGTFQVKLWMLLIAGVLLIIIMRR